MSKTGPLSNQTFNQVPPQNEKLHLFSSQITQLNSDYLEMQKNREEAKRQLELKFQDVHRRIQNTRDYLTQEGQKISNNLTAYQQRFITTLDDSENKLNCQHSSYKDQTQLNFQNAFQYLKDLFDKLEQEKCDRKMEGDQAFNQVKQELERLFETYESEKKNREGKEKEINQLLSDEMNKLNNKLHQEHENRSLKLKELRGWADQGFTTQRNESEEAHTKTVEEFNQLALNLTQEIDTRYDHQNKIINNFSETISVLQNTLKVIGKS